ncbi:MAG: PilZ domain-containing protein [Spirochaetaceae bacterium]|jgi:hypothetical protein|nr:PilZ domain-containing protein [Spirochaetaceae bacterium]
MGILTQQKIRDYYSEFKSIPVTFNKEIIQVTGLQTKQIILKCGSDFFPCFVYSTTFEEAKVVASNKSGIIKKLKEANNLASIKFTFKTPASGEQVAFLVSARVTGFSSYDEAADMFMFTLQFSNRPPDDLIGIVGSILEANVTSSKRKDERINITPESLRKLHLITKDVGVTMEGVPRRCILRDISFNGARLIMLGLSKFLMDKRVSIKFDFNEPVESYVIAGKVTNVENVADRKDMVVTHISYDDPIPMSYKIHLSNYLTSVRIIPTAAAPPIATAPASAGNTGTPT